MRKMLKYSMVAATGLLPAAIAQAHPGAHVTEGISSGLVHLLGEHGYLPILLLGIIAMIKRKGGSARSAIDDPVEAGDEKAVVAQLGDAVVADR